MSQDHIDSVDPDEDFGADLCNVEFIDNPEPRCPCVLLVDNSGSMAGSPIAELNRGLEAFQTDILRDPLAPRRVEIAIVTFGEEVKVVQNFVTVDSFTPPTLMAGGLTPMGSALLRALDLIQVRKDMYKTNGIRYYRPWLFLITDGSPEGEPKYLMEQATQRLRLAQENRHLAFFAVGVQGADTARLATLTVDRPPLKLQGLQFVELFRWLSNSMGRVSQSRPGENISLPPVDWGTV